MLHHLPATTDSPDATRALGAALAADLRAGDVVALHGDLGAGKTHLVQGLCEALGVPRARISSPTFALVHEYDGRDFPIVHLDAYRLDDPRELLDIGIEEYLDGDALALVEWPELATPFLPPHTFHLRLSHVGPSVRRVEQLVFAP